MKVRYLVTLPIVLVLLSLSKIGFAAEAPFIPPIADQTAVVGELFTYDVNAVLANPVETYELLLSRPGMSINPSTGLISWTPINAGDGGRVKVRAYNTAGESVRSFLIYLNEGIICDPDLVSYWTMDEASGTTYADEASGYDATALSPITQVTGQVGNAQQFSPYGKTDQFLTVPDQGQYNFARTGGFTVSMWIRYDGEVVGPDNQVLIARGDPNEFTETTWFNFMINEEAFQPDKRITLQLRPKVSGPISLVAHTENFLTPNVWHHVAAVYKGATYPNKITMTVYLDGIATSYSYSCPNADFTGELFPLNIGYLDIFPVNFPFNGSMDEVLIYDRALTTNEILQVRQSGTNGSSVCTPGNYLPLITSEPVTTVRQDDPYSYTVTAHDYDNNTISLSADVIPTWASFNTNTGVLSGTPGSTNVGDHTVRLVVSDGKGSSIQSFTIKVTDKNDPPVWTSTPLTTATENTAYSYSFLATDPEGDNLTYTVGTGLASWLSFNASSKLLVGIPQRTDVGDHAVKIRVSDGEFTVDQDFVITVASNNHAPVITSSPTASVNKLSPYSYRITATDADAGDVLTYSAQVLPSWLTFDPVSQMLSGTPQNNHVGSHPVVLVVSDGYDQTLQDFTIVVNNVNTAPVILSTPPSSVKVGELYAYFVEVVDYENDPVTLNGIIIPNWMSFDAASRVLSGIPTMNNIGIQQVIITASDAIFTVNHQFSITVSPPTGIEDVSSLVSKIYPNPAQEYVIFEFTGQASHIEITDLSGKILIKQTIELGAVKQQMDVSGLDKGMYMYRVTGVDVQQTGKLILN